MRTFLISIIFVVVLGGIVSAQVPAKPFTAYLQGGLTTVSSPEVFKDLHKLGYNITGGVGFSAAPMFQIVGKLGYHAISKDWIIPEGETITGGKVKVVTYGLDARFSPTTLVMPIKPYAYGGLGFAKISEGSIESSFVPIASLSAIQKQTKFYFNAGAGVEFSAGPVFKMFIEAQYLNIKTEGDNLVMIPLSLGIKF
jgi:opacity protein-like surface antigen